MLKINDLSKKFDNELVLDKFTLELFNEEILVILGRSGCGKTTLLKILTGILQQDTGSIIINDQDISKLGSQFRNFGYVPQNQILFNHLSVEENIKFGLSMKKLPIKEINSRFSEIITLTQVQNFIHRYPSELSLGQQQRVALARALILKPVLLLLDEPLSSIDYYARERLSLLIRQINQKTKIPIIYVTHNYEEAQLLADRIAIFSEGRIAQFGSFSEINRKLESFPVAKILGKPNIWPVESILSVKKNQNFELQTKLRSIYINYEENIPNYTWFHIPPEKIKFELLDNSDNSLFSDSCEIKDEILCISGHLISQQKIQNENFIVIGFIINQNTEFIKIKVKNPLKTDLKFPMIKSEISIRDISFFK